MPLLKTNDGDFKQDGKGKKEFPLLNIKNWHDTMSDIIKDSKRRLRIGKLVENENKRINVAKRKFETKPLSKDELLSRLNKFAR